MLWSWLELVKSNRPDKLRLGTHRQTQATTIPEDQNWSSVKRAWCVGKRHIRGRYVISNCYIYIVICTSHDAYTLRLPVKYDYDVWCLRLCMPYIFQSRKLLHTIITWLREFWARNVGDVLDGGMCEATTPGVKQSRASQYRAHANRRLDANVDMVHFDYASIYTS